MVIKILIALAVIVVVLVVVVATRPSEFRVQRTATMSAPAPVVFGQVNDFHKWEAWSPYAKRDPAMKKTIEGAPAGVGAIYTWSGNHEVGEGRTTIIESRPSELIRIKLEFVRPFAGTSTVAQHPAAPKPYGVLGLIRRSRDDVEGRIDDPGSGERTGMGFACVDDAFELRIGQEASGDDIGRQAWPVSGLGRRDRGHRCRLHEPGRMSLGSGNTNRLQFVPFIERLIDSAALGGLPIDGLVGELDGIRLERAGRNGKRPLCGDAAGPDCGRTDDGRKCCRADDSQPRRNLRGHPAEQRGSVGRHSW